MAQIKISAEKVRQMKEVVARTFRAAQRDAHEAGMMDPITYAANAAVDKIVDILRQGESKSKSLTEEENHEENNESSAE